MIYKCPVPADGSVEVTQAINDWIRSLPNGVAVFEPNGLYWTDGTIHGQSNIQYMGNGATFQRRTRSAVRDFPHWSFDGCQNFQVFDVRVVGEADLAAGYVKSLEAQHAFTLRTCEYGLLYNCFAGDVWGDGFNFHCNNTFVPSSDCQVLMGATGTVHRDPVAIGIGQWLTFRGCAFGHSFRSGIDLEPNGNAWTVSDILFTDCDWQSHRFNLMSAVPRQGTVENVTLYRCWTGSPLQIAVSCDPAYADKTGTPRRANFTIDSCSSTVQTGNPSGACMTFANVDGTVQVTNNQVVLQAGRVPPMRVARFDAHTTSHAQITYEGNTHDLG